MSIATGTSWNDRSMDTDLLTSVLRKNGHLGDATVLAADLTALKTNGIGSKFYAAKLQYSSDHHQLPTRMVIKRPLLADRGLGEAKVYERVLRHASGMPTMGYFGVVDEAPDKPLSLLFEDLSDSHEQSVWPIIPSLSDCERAVATLADIHAYWWGKAQSIDAGNPPVAPHQNTEHLAGCFSRFADFVGECLSPARIAQYEQVFSNLDALLANRLSAENTTLLHTDSHFWNFLYPKDKGQNRSVIFDWPLWRTGLSGCDLAYMIALHLYPEHRHRFESALLDHYWRVLRESGVSCSRADVTLDYRIGIIVGLLMPIMEFSWKIPPLDWIPKLEKGFSAYEDHNCQELLKAVD